MGTSVFCTCDIILTYAKSTRLHTWWLRLFILRGSVCTFHSGQVLSLGCERGGHILLTKAFLSFTHLKGLGTKLTRLYMSTWWLSRLFILRQIGICLSFHSHWQIWKFRKGGLATGVRSAPENFKLPHPLLVT